MDSAMKVTIFNDTQYTFKIQNGPYEPYLGSFLGKVNPAGQSGSAFHYEFFVSDTCRDWNLYLYTDESSRLDLFIPAQDNEDAREIRVYKSNNNVICHWISVPRHGSRELQGNTPAVQDLAYFETMKEEISTRMDTVRKNCMNLEELAKEVKICHAQCEHLVQTFSEGIRDMIETYLLVSKDPSQMWILYDSKKLRLLNSSLDSLMRSVKAAGDLLQACGGNEWIKIALVVSMPPPTVETYSRFALLIRELSWALDVIHYASCSKDLEFEWSKERCRLVVGRRNDSTDLSVNALEVAEVDGRLLQDRKNLLFQLESGESFTQENVSSSSATQKLNFPDDFGTLLKKRLQESAGVHSPGSVPTCFQINHLQLHLGRCISRGSFKLVYRGEWFGQRVAIAKIIGTTRDIVEKEAGFMVKVQHPNIVDFFGFAIAEREEEENVFEGKRKEDNLAEDQKRKGSSPEESGVKLNVYMRKEQERSPPEGRDMELVGYLVMELMEEDLRSLINREAKNHSGAPFSLSVSVDILLQIVEAMLHLQKHNIIYRDLKALNCLVSRRPKVNPGDPDNYTIKLIDFGTSKELESEDGETATIRMGSSRWMAPEIMGIKPSVNSRLGFLNPSRWFPQKATGTSIAYTRSADVYSFAMTCYEITTGLLPFHDVKSNEIPNMLQREERPLFSDPAAFSCPLPLQTLMKQCWAQHPTDRPQFEDVREKLWNIKYNIEVQR